MKLQIRLEGPSFPNIVVQVNAQSNDTLQQTNGLQLGQVDRKNETTNFHDRANLMEIEVLMRPA